MMITSLFYGKYAESFFKENLLLFLTHQQKKIVVLVSLIFGSLAACYVIYRACSFKAKISEDCHGVLNGYGKRIYADHVVGEGIFKEGELNGKGQLTYPNGTRAEGIFIEGVLNGEGQITLTNGVIRKGIFKNGRLNGQGQEIYPDGTIKEGLFEDNILIHPY